MDGCLPAGTVNFQVSDQHVAPPSSIQVNKGIGGEEPRGIQHVGITFTRGYYQARCLFLLSLHSGSPSITQLSIENVKNLTECMIHAERIILKGTPPVVLVREEIQYMESSGLANNAERFKRGSLFALLCCF